MHLSPMLETLCESSLPFRNARSNCMAAQKLEFHGAHSAPRGRQTIALIDLAVSQTTDGETIARLDGALRRLDGLTLLEWCVRRLAESTLVDSVVITGPQHFRERISQTGLCDARWVPSAFATPTQRASEIAERFNAQWIVFASPICPFTDPILLDRLVSRGWSHPDAEFVGFVTPNHPSFSLQSLGLVGEMCSSKALQKLSELNLQKEPCDVPVVIRRNIEQFTTKLIPLPEELSRCNMRFNLETVDDWDRAATLLEATGSDFCWQRLAKAASQLN